MTESAAKSLIKWMRKEGVQSFQYEGLTVAFHPSAVKTQDTRGAVSKKKGKDTSSTYEGDLSLEMLIPRTPLDAELSGI